MSEIHNVDRRTVLLTEYQAAQSSAQHHDQLLWTITGIVWAANLVLMGMIAKLPSGAWSMALRLLLCALGVISVVFVWSLQSQLRSVKNQKYARCAEIERLLAMTQHLSVEYKAGSQTLAYGLLSGVFIVLWIVVFVAVLAHGFDSPPNNRVNATVRPFTPLAVASGVNGRPARYALR